MWEYIAGIVDGEGSVGIIWRHRNFSALRPKGYLDPYIHISMCCEPVIRTIHKYAGIGSVYVENRRTKNNLTSYMYALNSFRDITTFLQQVYPYLIVKKQLASLLIEFCQHRMIAPRGTKRASSYTDRDWQIYFEQLHLQMKHNQSTIQLLKDIKKSVIDKSLLPILP